MREYKHRVNKVRALIVSDMRDRAVERAEHQAKANVFRVLMKPVLLKRALLFNARREMRSMIRSVFIVRRFVLYLFEHNTDINVVCYNKLLRAQDCTSCGERGLVGVPLF